MIDGNGKKVLMFCPTFFGYEKRLENALKSCGYAVDLYDERPSNGFFGKTFIRLGFKIYRPVVKKYVERIIAENRAKDYDYILVVKGEVLWEAELSLLRAAFPNAKFVLYLWDSVINTRNCEKNMPLYDKVLSFDPEDAKRFNLPFLPIPFGKEYSYEEAEKYEYAAAFIGTAHSVRPRVVKQIKKQLEDMGEKCFTYFYSPHILVFWLNKFTNPDYKYLSLKEVNFKPISAKDVSDVYNKTKCVIDIEHPRQKGATTRPVELLPMKKKIITTNSYVKNFKFYNDNNFLIIDRDNPVIDKSFFTTDYSPIDDNILELYSPSAFVEKCLDFHDL